MMSLPQTYLEKSIAPTPAPLRVVVADAYAATRDVIEQVLAGEDRFRVVATAGTLEETLHLLDESDPDILLVDPWLSGPAGLPACLAAKQFRPHLLLVALLPDEREDYRRAAQALGADASLQKRQIARRLIATLQEALRARRQ